MTDPATSGPPRRCAGPLCLGQARPLADFGPDAARKDGLQARCRACQVETMRLRRAADPDKYREYDRLRRAADPGKAREQKRRQAASARDRCLARYGRWCTCCGTTDDLTIDHVGGGGAAHRAAVSGARGGSRFYAWLAARGFPPGYQTMCRPCNASKGDGERCRIAHDPAATAAAKLAAMLHAVETALGEPAIEPRIASWPLPGVGRLGPRTRPPRGIAAGQRAAAVPA